MRRDDPATVVERERERFAGKAFAFFVDPAGSGIHGYPFGVGIAVLGESGYYTPLYEEIFPSYEAASERAARLNNVLGYSSDTALCIVGDTMRRSERIRDEAAGITTIKLSEPQITHLLSAMGEAQLDDTDAIEDDLIDMLVEAKSEIAGTMDADTSRPMPV